jgi:hypothetical protein
MTSVATIKGIGTLNFLNTPTRDVAGYIVIVQKKIEDFKDCRKRVRSLKVVTDQLDEIITTLEKLKAESVDGPLSFMCIDAIRILSLAAGDLPRAVETAHTFCMAWSQSRHPEEPVLKDALTPLGTILANPKYVYLKRHFGAYVPGP